MINCEGHVFSVAVPARQQASYDRGAHAAGRAHSSAQQNTWKKNKEKKRKNKAQALDGLSVLTPTS